ncbi:hypothetical protein AN189_03650 [Loktanella sp. 3ANDIMAR09]|uniref:helix-turn-helix transcriptional regulator n=1 Tax=Loktanella sp. 3ANDIMAR09 TaxID=1225657 RepID=UPI0006F547E0|nr:helix-turn-helix transcriptional regulator [Loktanella sp. 3ANDIMAR09]KQI69509.1 hypothetical protein AN189_03650 [Loktanella sp. 3ANDIMAR09]
MDRTGDRIRARRMDAGVAQRDLAAAVDISASYLNLIEHGKRPVGGQLLRRIAATLGIDLALLERPADPSLIDRLLAASARLPQVPTEVAQVEDLAARFPGWTGLITAQAQEIMSLDDRLQMLNDRLTYDPDLAKALHGVITAVTAIQSTATILTGDGPVDADWQARFHANIRDDAGKLAATSRALVAYLDAPDDLERTRLSPLEARDAILNASGYHRPHLEDPAQLEPEPPARQGVADLLARYDEVYAADVAALPIASFVTAARALDCDPVGLAARLGQPLDRVMRRLASLPAKAGLPDHGLMQVTASGAVLLLKQAAGFDMTRGSDCALWPVYTALGQAGRCVTARVAVHGQNDRHLQCHAVAVAAPNPLGPHAPPVMTSTMLVRSLPEPPDPLSLPVGLACRMCPRDDCAARREPAVPATQL